MCQEQKHRLARDFEGDQDSRTAAGGGKLVIAFLFESGAGFARRKHLKL